MTLGVQHIHNIQLSVAVGVPPNRLAARLWHRAAAGAHQIPAALRAEAVDAGARSHGAGAVPGIPASGATAAGGAAGSRVILSNSKNIRIRYVLYSL